MVRCFTHSSEPLLLCQAKYGNCKEVPLPAARRERACETSIEGCCIVADESSAHPAKLWISGQGIGRVGVLRRGALIGLLAATFGTAVFAALSYSAGGKMHHGQCANASQSATQHGPRGAKCIAQELLAELPLPKGAGKVGVVRQLKPQKERWPQAGPCRPVVEIHGYWHVPGVASEVIKWIQTHPPAGVIPHTGGSGEGNGEWSGWLSVAVKEPNVVQRETLNFVAIEAPTKGGAVLRGDAVVAPVGARCVEYNY